MWRLSFYFPPIHLHDTFTSKPCSERNSISFFLFCSSLHVNTVLLAGVCIEPCLSLKTKSQLNYNRTNSLKMFNHKKMELAFGLLSISTGIILGYVTLLSRLAEAKWDVFLDGHMTLLFRCFTAKAAFFDWQPFEESNYPKQNDCWSFPWRPEWHRQRPDISCYALCSDKPLVTAVEPFGDINEASHSHVFHPLAAGYV